MFSKKQLVLIGYVLLAANVFEAALHHSRAKRQDITFRSTNGICTTPNGQNGKCTRLTQCAALKSAGLRIIRNSICAYDGFQPMVCCPLSAKDGDKLTTNAPIPDRNSELGFKNEDGCGLSDNLDGKIISGQPASLNAWPWMAAIYDIQFGREFFRCGGTLINRNYVITAAHCLVDFAGYIPADRFLVRLGDLDLKSDADGAFPVVVKVNNIKIHEQFRPRENDQIIHDIALFRLAQPVTFTEGIRPICLPGLNYNSDSAFDQMKAFVIGWGRTENGTDSDILRQVQLPVQTVGDCKRVYSGKPIDSTHICAGLPQGGKDSCQGDSGGPLMVTDVKRTFRNAKYPPFLLIGIVSSGAECAKRGFFGIYTRVTSYTDWISKNVN